MKKYLYFILNYVATVSKIIASRCLFSVQKEYVQKEYGPTSTAVVSVERVKDIEHPRERTDREATVSLEYHKKTINEMQSVLKAKEAKINDLTGQLERSRENLAEHEDAIATLEVELEVLRGHQ